MTALADKVTTLIIQWAPDPLSHVTADDRLVEDLFYDSLALIELATSLSTEFSVTMPEEQLSTTRCVGDVVTLVAELVATR